jgi:hypothetical protein
MSLGQHRSTTEVFEDHLRLRLEGNLEEDLRRNYAEDVVLLTVNSNATGHEALRMSAERLSRQLPEAEFSIAAKQVSGPYALLIWSATSPRLHAVEGADTFVFRDGKIVLQTIHYGLRQSSKAESTVTTKGIAGADDGAP